MSESDGGREKVRGILVIRNSNFTVVLSTLFAPNLNEGRGLNPGREMQNDYKL